MKDLTLYSPIFGDMPVAVPCVKMSFYLTEPASRCARGVAHIIQLYAGLVPSGAIRGRVAWDDDDDEETYIVPFDIRDARLIEAEFQPQTFAGMEMYTAWLLGSESVQATGYSVTIKLSDTETETKPDWLNYVELTLPLELVKERTTTVKDLFVAVLETVECRSANCGLSLDFTTGVEPFIRADVNARLMRFIGLDGCYEHHHFSLGTKLSHVSWLTYSKAPGLTRLFDAPLETPDIGEARSEVFAGGRLFQASALPALGNVNSGARDLGALPTLDRALAPFMVSDTSYFKWMDAELAERWVDRFRDVTSGPWDNTGLVPY